MPRHLANVGIATAFNSRRRSTGPGMGPIGSRIRSLRRSPSTRLLSIRHRKHSLRRSLCSHDDNDASIQERRCQEPWCDASCQEEPRRPSQDDARRIFLAEEEAATATMTSTAAMTRCSFYALGKRRVFFVENVESRQADDQKFRFPPP